MNANKETQERIADLEDALRHATASRDAWMACAQELELQMTKNSNEPIPEDGPTGQFRRFVFSYDLDDGTEIVVTADVLNVVELEVASAAARAKLANVGINVGNANETWWYV